MTATPAARLGREGREREVRAREESAPAAANPGGKLGRGRDAERPTTPPPEASPESDDGHSAEPRNGIPPKP